MANPASVLEGAHANPIPREGFGMAMAEAMAFALPVVAVDAGASREMLEPGVTGLLVPEDDSPALANAIIQLLKHRDIAAEMGEAARRRAVSSYGAQRTAQATLAFYRQLREEAIA